MLEFIELILLITHRNNTEPNTILKENLFLVIESTAVHEIVEFMILPMNMEDNPFDSCIFVAESK